MKNWAFSAALAGLLIAGPALAQESLLPDIFGSPPPEPKPAPVVEPAPGDTPGAVSTAPGQIGIAPFADHTAQAVPSGPDPLASAPTRVRNVNLVGPLTSRIGGYGSRAFAGSNGAFLAQLLERLRTPLASRWGHIVLRRALLTRAPTPAGVRPADWIAARALVLLKIGEADGAKLLVEALPLDSFTPKLYGVASQVHLAAADILALCPLAPSAQGFSKDDLWDLVSAMCAGIEGDDASAATQFDRLRRRNTVKSIDVLLAERVTSAATGQGRGANVNWDNIDTLNAYRFGLAAAAGVEMTDTLVENMSDAMIGWTMRAPGVPVERRAAVAARAAALGVVSANELTALSSAQLGALADEDYDPSLSVLMRTAFAGASVRERLRAMHTIWKTGDTHAERYGRLIQTAKASVRIPPAIAQAPDAERLIASMLSAGYAEAALKWWPTLKKSSDKNRLGAWALLALADPGDRIEVSPRLLRSWHESLAGDAERVDRKAGLMVAALRGLGKASGGIDNLAMTYKVETRPSRYTRALAKAAASGRKGDVAILAAIGMQSRWAGISPGQLEAILAAYMKVGLDDEARMLAVEALTRN